MYDKRDNLSVVLYGKDDLRIEQTSLPDKPLPDGMLIRNFSFSLIKFTNVQLFFLCFETTEVQLATHTGKLFFFSQI